MHDWPDHKAIVILKNIRKAMNAGARLLLEEYVLTLRIEI
jgi:hypothetical protein